jgi:hypothetical protein
MRRSPSRLLWDVPDPPPTRHPYRDTLVVYAGLAIVIVLFAWITGGPVGKALMVAAVFFVVASSWSVYRWRIQLAKARSRDGAENS